MTRSRSTKLTSDESTNIPISVESKVGEKPTKSSLTRSRTLGTSQRKTKVTKPSSPDSASNMEDINEMNASPLKIARLTQLSSTDADFITHEIGSDSNQLSGNTSTSGRSRGGIPTYVGLEKHRLPLLEEVHKKEIASQSDAIPARVSKSRSRAVQKNKVEDTVSMKVETAEVQEGRNTISQKRTRKQVSTGDTSELPVISSTRVLRSSTTLKLRPPADFGGSGAYFQTTNPDCVSEVSSNSQVVLSRATIATTREKKKPVASVTDNRKAPVSRQASKVTHIQVPKTPVTVSKVSSTTATCMTGNRPIMTPFSVARTMSNVTRPTFQPAQNSSKLQSGAIFKSCCFGGSAGDNERDAVKKRRVSLEKHEKVSICTPQRTPHEPTQQSTLWFKRPMTPVAHHSTTSLSTKSAKKFSSNAAGGSSKEENAHVESLLEQKNTSIQSQTRRVAALLQVVQWWHARWEHSESRRTQLLTACRDTDVAILERIKSQCQALHQAELDAERENVAKCVAQREVDLENVRLEHAKAEESLAQQHYEQLQALNENCERRIRELHMKYEEAHHNDLQKQAAIVELETVVADLRGELEKSKNANSQLESQCTTLSNQVHEYETHVQEICDARVQAAVQTYHSYPAEVESLKVVIELKKDEIQELKDRLAESQGKMSQMKDVQIQLDKLMYENENMKALLQLKTDDEQLGRQQYAALMARYRKESEERVRLARNYDQLLFKFDELRYALGVDEDTSLVPLGGRSKESATSSSSAERVSIAPAHSKAGVSLSTSLSESGRRDSSMSKTMSLTFASQIDGDLGNVGPRNSVRHSPPIVAKLSANNNGGIF